MALLLGAWIAVTVAGAGQAADEETWLQLPSFAWVSYVALAVVSVTFLAILVSAAMVRGESRPQRKKRRSFWPMLLLLLLFLALSQRGLADNVAEPVIEADPETAEEVVESTDRISNPGPGELLALVAIVVAAAGLLFWTRRGEVPPEIVEEEPLETVLAPAIEQASEHLSLGDDPRSSVLRAYDELESALRAQGLPRGLTETPTEHLRRVLHELGGDRRDGRGFDPEPLLRLAGLYEIARFSDRPISAGQQQQAARWLDEVRRRMAAI